MKHGIEELNKLLHKFQKMSISEYLEIYNLSISRDKIEVANNSIVTDLSYSAPQYINSMDIFEGVNIEFSFDENDNRRIIQPILLKAA